MDKGDMVLIIIFIGCMCAAGYAVYTIWWDNFGQPAPGYCRYVDGFVYVNDTVITKFDKCFNYLLDQDYRLVDKNGSYYILEPKN